MFLEKLPRYRGWPIHTLISWRINPGSVGVYLLDQDRARTVEDPLTAYFPGKVTWVLWQSTFCTRNQIESWGTHLQPMFLEKSPRYRGWPVYTLSSWRNNLGSVEVDLFHKEPTRTLRDRFTAYVPREVIQVSRINLSFRWRWRNLCTRRIFMFAQWYS